MPKKVICIEPDLWWTKVAVAECRRKSPQIFDLFYFRTPEHAVEDGYIRDRESFAVALREELAKRLISVKNVIFTINSTKVITRELTVPMVKDNQLPIIVQTQAREHFPMDTAGYSITYKKMGGQADESEKNIKILMIAVPENLLSNYYTFAREMGFSVEAFDYIGNSALSFANSYYDDDGVVVQLQEQSTVISFIKDKKLVFQRVAPNGYGTTLGTVLDHSALGVKDEYEAFDFLLANDVLYGKPSAEDLPEDAGEAEGRLQVLEDAYEDVRDALNYHVRAVSTALDYYRNQTKEEFTGTLRLIGEGARIAGLRRMFAEELPLKVEDVNYNSLLRFSHELMGRNVAAVDYLTLIGATIQPLDILPREVREREGKKSTLRLAYVAFFVSAAASVILVMGGIFRSTLAASEQKRLQKRISDLSYIEEIYEENEVTRRVKETYESFDNQTKTDNERLGELIDALEEQLPTVVTIQNFSASGNTITMSVTCSEKLTAAQLLLNLQEIPYLGNFRIPSMSERQNLDGSSEWQFSVTANYVEPPVEAAGEE